MNHIGGQAVLEGVMMRYKHRQALAVRSPDGDIVVEVTHVAPLSERWSWLKLPLLRGMAALVDALSGAVKTLGRSAQIVSPEEEISGRDLALAVTLALLLAVGLFFVLPAVVVTPLSRLGWPPAAVSLVEGLVRISVLVSYLLLVRLNPDIRRTFAYHGAEHKAIFSWESGSSNLEDALQASCSHPRCGTSFILLVVVTGIIVFSFISPPTVLWRMASRILLLPLLAGIAYEFIRWTGSSNSPVARMAMAPGMALQRLTTLEPDREQVEVAMAALQAVVDPDWDREYNDSHSETVQEV